MRQEPTDGEAALWELLRARRLGGWKFRRQHVIAGYIVDFYCAELRLAIEVDGAIHDTNRVQDEQRDADLGMLGVQVQRVRNADVLSRSSSVLRTIAIRCESVAEQTGFCRHDGYRTPKR